MTASDAVRKGWSTLPLTVWLLAAGLFLSCIFGGYIVNDATHLAPGIDSLFLNIFGGSDAPLLTHAVISLPVVAALVLSLLSRRIQQVPGQIFTSVWILFFFFLGVSTALSSFKALSLTIWFEWLVYGCTLFGVVTCAGRTRGPAVLLTALAAGCTVVALKGIVEYGQMRSSDPTWRVFAGWVNPNATAALLLVGFFVALGLCLERERVESLVAGIATVLIAFAIFLTGSKGAASMGLPLGTIAFGAAMTRVKGRQLAALAPLCLVCAALVGALFLKNVGWFGLLLAMLFAGACLALWGASPRRKNQALRLVACYGAFIAVLALLTFTSQSGHPEAQAAPTVSSPIARVTSGDRTEQQSSTFRLNLWKSALHLVKERPLTGWGMATYRYESGRLGLATATIFAHSTYLQIFAECGVAAFGLFLVGLGTWFRMVTRNHSRLPESALVPLASVVAGVTALLAHSMVDSDLYYFGIGIVFFALLGIGLLLSVDSVAPEFVPKPIRVLSAMGALALVLVLFVAAAADDLKSRFRNDASTGSDLATVQADAEAMAWVEQFDGDAAYLDSELKTGEPKAEALAQAFRLAPTEKVARALAKEQQAEGRAMSAIDTLKLALQRDPNNLVTLAALIRLYTESGDLASAIDTAKRLIAIEQTPYFKVRSIPESVPTETYEARFDVLAPNEPDPKRRADLLAGGVRGMLGYANVTAKYIFGNSGYGKNPDFKMPGYDSLNEARLKLDKAVNAAKAAAQVYGALGDRTAAAEMEADGPVLAGAFAAANSPK